MLINKNKSGIMLFDCNLPRGQDTLGYPVVSRYRYLGFHVTPQLLMSDHIKAISGKVVYLRGQLAPVLRKGQVRFNVSLFRTLMMPLYRLSFPLYDLSSQGEKDHLRVAIRKQTRAFLGLPPNSPNRIVRGLEDDRQ